MKKSDLELIYVCLSFCGFWPPDDDSDNTYAITMKISLIIYCYHVFGVICYIITIIPDSRVPGPEKLESIFIISGLFQMVFNCAAMFIQRYKIKELLADIENFENYGRPENLQKISLIVNTLTFILVAYCVAGGFFISLFPVYQYEECMSHAELSNKTIVCGFGTKVSYPYDVQSGFIYAIHVGIELYTICFACSGGVINVNCCMASFEFIILRIDQLKDMLHKVFETNDHLEQKKRFRECTIFHIYIINLVKKTNNCFTTVTFPALVYYSIVIGTTLMAFLTGHTVISFLNLCGWGFGVYIMCLTGQRIHDKSLSVAETVYAIEWYVSEPKLRKDILIMLCRSQKPLMYECGILGDFHFVTFNNIMSAGYKFSTLKTRVSN